MDCRKEGWMPLRQPIAQPGKRYKTFISKFHTFMNEASLQVAIHPCTNSLSHSSCLRMPCHRNIIIWYSDRNSIVCQASVVVGQSDLAEHVHINPVYLVPCVRRWKSNYINRCILLFIVWYLYCNCV